MKTSIILITAIIINTTLLLSDPLATLVKEIDTWALLIIEAVLLCGYYIHKTVKDLREASEIKLIGFSPFEFKPFKRIK